MRWFVTWSSPTRGSVDNRRARRDNAHFIGDPDALHLVSSSVADTDCNVLVTGSSGTGKELVARPYMRRATVGINRLWPSTVLRYPGNSWKVRSWAYEGAFTGPRRLGRVNFRLRMVEPFLDEIGEMDLSLRSTPQSHSGARVHPSRRRSPARPMCESCQRPTATFSNASEG